MRYFFRELGLDRPIILAGQTYKFDLKQLEDNDPLVPLLDACVKKGIGGVVPLSESEYTDALKKKNSGESSRSRMHRDEVKPKLLPFARKGSAVRVEDKPALQTPEQVAVTRDFSSFMPSVSSGVLT